MASPTAICAILCVVSIAIVSAANGGTKDPSGGPAMVRFPNFKGMFIGGPHNLKYWKFLKIDQKYKYLPVAYSNVPGKEMQGGLLELRQGDVFTYTQWYDSFLYILDGMMEIEDKRNMQEHKAKTGDMFKISIGTQVTFKHTDASNKVVRAYWVATVPGPSYSFFMQGEIKKQPKIYRKNDLPGMIGKLPLFKNEWNSLSYLEDLMVVSDEGRELAAGLYELRKGPALHYTYEYEEFKYIMTGQFDLLDGTGQKVAAKAGDLMYFPKGCAVKFESGTDKSMGLYVGQRIGGTA